MKKLTIREIHNETGIAVPTITRWCREGKFTTAEKKATPAGEFWEIDETEWKDFAKSIGEVKPGRPKKRDYTEK